MFIGVCTIELFIPESSSLKNKRQVLKSIKDRVRQSFNVSVSEVDTNDLWQRAVLGIACVGNEKRYINGMLDKIVDFVRGNHSVELINYKIELI